MRNLFATFLLIIFACRSWAGMFFEFEGGSYTDSFSTNSIANLNNNMVLGYALWEANEHFKFGWSYLSFYQTQTGAVKEVYQSTDTGPVVTYTAGKKVIFEGQLGYSILTNATYQSGTTNYSYSGTSLFGAIAVLGEFRESYRIGLGVLTYGASFASYTNANTKVVYNSGSTKNTSIPLLIFSLKW